MKFGRKHGEDEIRNCIVCDTAILVPAWRKNDPTRGKFCSKKCCYKGRDHKNLFEKGHVDFVPKEKRGHSTETREKMKIANRNKGLRGPAIWNYKGGSQSTRHQEMGRFEYKDWRNSVFTRDNYTCQCCGDRGVYLHADHIAEWSKDDEKRYSVDNGKTLCYRCHYKKTFPQKEYNEYSAIRWGIPKKYRENLKHN